MRIIKSREEFVRVFKNGKRLGSSLLTVLIAPTLEQRGQDGRVAFAAGKKLGNAVMRNRCKRVMRASVMRLGGPWDGFDIILLAKRAIATAPYEQVDKELSRALKRSGIDVYSSNSPAVNHV